jgi:hypothetical protein
MEAFLGLSVVEHSRGIFSFGRVSSSGNVD